MQKYKARKESSALFWKGIYRVTECLMTKGETLKLWMYLSFAQSKPDVISSGNLQRDLNTIGRRRRCCCRTPPERGRIYRGFCWFCLLLLIFWRGCNRTPGERHMLLESLPPACLHTSKGMLSEWDKHCWLAGFVTQALANLCAGQTDRQTDGGGFNRCPDSWWGDTSILPAENPVSKKYFWTFSKLLQVVLRERN